MSALKVQLRLILPGLSKEANANQDKEIRRHLYLIKAVCASPKSVKQVCEARGVSTDQFYLWGRRLLKGKVLQSLLSISRKPRRSPRQTKKRVERRILALRKAEPSYGAERISFDLLRLFKIKCAPMTVYNVLKRLKLISPDHSRRLTKRHHKRYRRPLPGYVQMDVKYVPYKIEGQQFYEFNAVDHCTTWRLIRAYKSISYQSLVHFLSELERECPFLIFEIQTDNGIEFTDKYRNGLLAPSGAHPLDQWCLKKGITHRLIPIGQKELNGKVENTHKQDDREFYAKDKIKNFEALQQQMKSYNQRWNQIRATKALGWKTPIEAIESAAIRAIAFLIFMKEKYPTPIAPSYALNSNGDAFFSVPKPRTRKKIKRKRVSHLDRYLQWLDSDDKKNLKALLPLPVMSQIFSRLPGLTWPATMS